MKTEPMKDVEKTQTQIANQMEIQSKNLALLEGATMRLFGRLEQIITQPTPSEVDEKPERELVPLANMLRKNNCFIEQITNGIGDLIGRLEL